MMRRTPRASYPGFDRQRLVHSNHSQRGLSRYGSLAPWWPLCMVNLGVIQRRVLPPGPRGKS